MTTGGAFQSLPTSGATNRLSLAGTTYDAAGNLTRLSLGGEMFEYEYDGVSMMRSLISNTDQAKVFLYDASDERIAVFECVTGSGASACATSSEREHWYVRDLDGKVLRSWEHRFQANGWTWREDNIFRNGQPLATLLNNGSGNDNPRHLHLDHLGTPRQITDSSGTEVAFHSYYPFGEEATDPNQDPVRLKFTGHERDQNGGGEGQLDYMHARYESPMIGRFLSVDPIGGDVDQPQTWNRYSYVRNRPQILTDPAGLFPVGQASIQIFFSCLSAGICADADVVADQPAENLTGLSGLQELRQGLGSLLGSLADGVASRFSSPLGDDFVGLRVDNKNGIICSIFASGAEDCGPVLLGTMPGPPGLQGKRALDVIVGPLRRSKSYQSELAEFTYEQILKLAKGRGPARKAARGMSRWLLKLGSGDSR